MKCKGITKNKKECCRTVKNGEYCFNHKKITPENNSHSHLDEDVLTLGECPICYDLLSLTDVLECNHKVHISCVEKSFKAECPLCRHSLTKLPETVLKNIKINSDKIEAERRVEEEQATMRLIQEFIREQGGIDILRSRFVCGECDINHPENFMREMTEGEGVYIVRLQ